MDSYSLPTNSPYYFGPVHGKRINHFEDNLRQALECADEYIWFWGEKGFYIDWPADLKEKSGDTWRSHDGTRWRRKYFEGYNGKWNRIRPWNETFDGDFDLLCRGVKEPVRCVEEQYASQKAEGLYRDMAAGRVMNVSSNGNSSICIRGVFEPGCWYGVRVKGRGELVRGNIFFQSKGVWRWKLGSFNLDFAPPDADGWRQGNALVRIPGDATDIYILLDAGKDENIRKVEFGNLEIFRIK